MYIPESLIIDNNKLRLFEELNNILKEQKSISVASAYFNIAGFQLIKDSLLGAEKLRLLIGTSPQTDEKKPDVFQPEELYKKKFREDLEEENFERAKKEAADSRDFKDVFEIHGKVREKIKSDFSEGVTATIRTSQGRVEKDFRDMRDELDYIRQNYLENGDPTIDLKEKPTSEEYEPLQFDERKLKLICVDFIS